jgi:Domain of unknown function (DUF2024)
MKIAVWDTYVSKRDGNVMHFDIFVAEELKDSEMVYSFGKEYLKSKNQEGQPLTSEECKFCHIETMKPEWKEIILKQGYFIYEMENCN